MPYPSYSAGDLTTIREGGGLMMLPVLNAGYVLVQFNPSGSASSADNNSIDVGTILSGATSNVPKGATLLITPTTDYVNDLLTRRDECVISFTNAEVSGGAFETGTLAYAWSSSDVVTILAEARPHTWRPRTIDGVTYRLYDVTYQAQPPRIEFYHDAVFISGASTSYSPSWTATAMTASGSISSHKWDTIVKNGSGFTATLNASASATPSFTLPLGVNWLVYTATDNNGNTSTVWGMVAVLPDTLNSIVNDVAESYSITREVFVDGMGVSGSTSANVTMLADTSDVLNGSPMMLVGFPVFADGTTSDVTDNPVQHFGYISSLTDTTDPDGNKRTALQIDGVIEALSRLSVDSQEITLSASPTAWGQLDRTSLFDMVWFVLAFHTVNPPPLLDSSDILNYVVPSYQFDTSDVWSVISALMLACAYAPEISANGELRFAIDAALDPDTTNRAGATTLLTFSTSDFTLLGYNALPLATTQSAYISTRAYNETTNVEAFYEGVAPEFESDGQFRQSFNQRVLEKDLSDTTAKIRTGVLAFNVWALQNINTSIDIDILSGFYNLVPIRSQLIKTDIDASTLLTGITVATSIEFVLEGITLSSGGVAGEVQVSARLAARSGGQTDYAIAAYNVIAPPDADPYNDLPVGEPSPNTNWGNGSAYANVAIGAPYEDDQSVPSGTLPPSPAGSEIKQVPFNGEVVTFSETVTSGSTVLISASGVGIITKPGTQTSTTDFTVGQTNGWDITEGIQTANGVEAVFNNFLQNQLYFETLNDFQINEVRVTYSASTGDGTGQSAQFIAYTVGRRPSGSSIGVIDSQNVQSSSSASSAVQTFNPSPDIGGDTIEVQFRRPSGFMYIEKIEIDFTSTLKRYADPISYWDGNTYLAGIQVEFGGTNGLIVDGGQRLATNAESRTHTYNQIAYTKGTTGTISFEFVDPDGNYDDNEGVMLVRIDY